MTRRIDQEPSIRRAHALKEAVDAFGRSCAQEGLTLATTASS
jgi:hypothetical protein